MKGLPAEQIHPQQGPSRPTIQRKISQSEKQPIKDQSAGQITEKKDLPIRQNSQPKISRSDKTTNEKDGPHQTEQPIKKGLSARTVIQTEQQTMQTDGEDKNSHFSQATEEGV